MNKTVNINLAGIFFHIDEDAYLKLQRYLEAIKRSFTDSQGRSEIISDIEARIAELFSERLKDDKQVISSKQVDEVIDIMGQPEDYLVDDEIFEDGPERKQKGTSTSKKLFRDTENSYIGGVASGLAHYLGIDAVWLRLIWLLLAIGSGGTFILIYILFWILVPEAKTTADKLNMTGEPVNISNIEKKIKDGFETVSQTVSDTVKNVDLNKQGQRIKSSSKTFFDTIGEIIMFFLKIFAKFIGIILMIIGASALIGLIITLFSIGAIDIIHIPGIDLIDVVNTGNTPIWLVSLLAFFSIGIPFFFVFYLGLKILVNNLKSIGRIAKFTLLGVWLLSIIGLIIIGVKQASEHAFNERVIIKNELMVKPNDTLKVKMLGNDLYKNSDYRHSGSFKVAFNENEEKTIYSSDIRVIVKSTTDSLGTISIEKSADGRDYEKAIERAKNINYAYKLEGNELLLDSYLSTDPDNKFSNQEILVTINLPEGVITNFSKNTKSYLHYYDSNIVRSNKTNHYLKILEDDIECLDCPIDVDFDVDVDMNGDNSGIKINEDGIEVKIDSSSLKINRSGLKAKSNDLKVNIDAGGVKIKSDKN